MSKYIVLVSCSKSKIPGGDNGNIIESPFREQYQDIRQKLQDRKLLREIPSQPRERIGKDQLNAVMPAFWRYAPGRFFKNVYGLEVGDGQRIDPHPPENIARKWAALKDRGVEVYIMSGLFGLIGPDTRIHSYDVHLSDFLEQDRSCVLLRDYWRGHFTRFLIDRVKNLNRKVILVDMLSERWYQDAIDWGWLHEEVPCWHRASEQAAGPDILPALGRAFAQLFYCNDTQDNLIGDEQGEQTPLVGQTGIRFHRNQLGTGLIEGLEEYGIWLDGLRQKLTTNHDKIDVSLAKELASAGFLFERAISRNDSDYGVVLLPIFRAVEVYLKNAYFGPCNERIEIRRKEWKCSSYMKDRAGFAELVTALEGSGVREIARLVYERGNGRTLVDLRNDIAHKAEFSVGRTHFTSAVKGLTKFLDSLKRPPHAPATHYYYRDYNRPGQPLCVGHKT